MRKVIRRRSHRWLFALVCVFFLAGCQPHFYRAVGRSMEPAIPENARIYVESYGSNSIRRGDVVVFRHNGREIIKRVIALPGEIVEGRSGAVIVNGTTLSEPYVKRDPGGPTGEDTFAPRTIPKDQLFVMGDYRSVSLDSRADEYGSVFVSDVVGHYISRY